MMGGTLKSRQFLGSGTRACGFFFFFLPVMMERVKGEAGLGSGASVTSESTGNGVTPCP